MNMEKFTQKAQAGVQAAREVAIRFGHQEVDPRFRSEAGATSSITTTYS